MKIVTVAEMRRIEAAAIAQGISAAVLMESAGRACADEILKRVDVRTSRFVVLVGPGNNGGDALVTAHYLAAAGGNVTVLCATERDATDSNLRRLLTNREITVYPSLDLVIPQLPRLLEGAVIIDGLLGTGRTRPIDDQFSPLPFWMNTPAHGRPVFAIDVPSGLNADTGEFDDRGVRADVTLALGFPKVGHIIGPGAVAVGELCVLDIGLPQIEEEDEPWTQLITREWAKLGALGRPRDAHKGTFGRLLIIGGCAQYYGAPVIAAAAALRSGAGVVQLAVPGSIVPVLASKLTEATFLPLAEDQPGYIGPAALDALLDACGRADTVVLGCGIGLNPTTKTVVQRLIAAMPKDVPLLVDADALTILAETPEWWTRRPDRMVLTPHAGEMGRLLGVDAATVQGNRLELARSAAQKWGVTVVLKGAGTIIADPFGDTYVSAVATPALATAGTGDCLAGVIGALLGDAHKQPQFDAIDWYDGTAALGVYLHGEAGLLAEREIGQSGALASDIVERLPRVFQMLRLAAKK